MNFNRETLAKLHELTNTVRETEEIASETLRTAQDRFKDVKHPVEREGKTIELTEKILWDEVFYLGVGCQAAKILKGIHPEVFEAFAKQDEAASELKKFCIVELGVDYTKLTLSDYLVMTEQLVEVMLQEREAKK